MDVARVLLEAGCNKGAVWASKNNLTALDLAVRANGQDELETLLREHDVPANSHLTNWRDVKKKVLPKLSVVNAFKNSGKPSAVEGEEPKSPLSPSQRFKKDKAERELAEKDLKF